MFDKRAEERDPGEKEQNKAIEKGLAEKPKIEKEKPELPAGVCPTCKRDMVNA